MPVSKHPWPRKQESRLATETVATIGGRREKVGPLDLVTTALSADLVSGDLAPLSGNGDCFDVRVAAPFVTDTQRTPSQLGFSDGHIEKEK
jgi:hypothetical protein